MTFSTLPKRILKTWKDPSFSLYIYPKGFKVDYAQIQLLIIGPVMSLSENGFFPILSFPFSTVRYLCVHHDKWLLCVYSIMSRYEAQEV